MGLGLTRPRVVVADDCASIRRQLEIVLCSDFEVVALAANGVEAVGAVERLHPDVVLLDLHMPNLNGVEATRSIVDRFPDIGVVVLTVENDVAYLHKAMEAGAREYLHKPSNPGEIRDVVERIAHQAIQRRQLLGMSGSAPGSGVWSFCGASGGEGRTSLLLGLAAELRSLGRQVAVVDLDSYFGDAGFSLALQPGEVNLFSYQSADRLDRTVRALDFTTLHASGLRFIGPPRDPLQAARLDPGSALQFIRELEQQVDYVLVDLPAGVPEAHLEILDRSRFVFSVSSSGLMAMRNHGVLNQLLQEIGFRATSLVPLVTRSPDPEATREATSVTQIDPVAIFPEDSEGMALALRSGQPVTRVAPRSPFTRKIREFLVDLLELPADTYPVEARPASLLRRLFEWAA